MTPDARMALLGEFVNAIHAVTGDFPVGSEDVYDRLAQRYDASDRAYHNLDHIEAMLHWLLRLGKSLRSKERAILTLATFYHDAVYDSREKDNEERSAALARIDLVPLGVRDQDVAAIERLILLTKSHQIGKFDRIGRMLIDADLAILQSAPETYDRYSKAIREEYAWVREEDYRIGRAKVLQGLMAKKLYHSPLLDEEAARANISREIHLLLNS